MVFSATTEPSAYGLGGSGGIPSEDNVVLTFPMAASASVSQGDFVKLTSTTAGTIERCTATSDSVLGIADVTVDNSSGSAADKYCGVLKRGFTYIDGIVAASGTYDEPIRFNDALYLTGSAVAATDAGQRLTSTTDTGVGTAKIAVALDAVAAPSTSYTLAKIRVYVDFLSNKLDT